MSAATATRPAAVLRDAFLLAGLLAMVLGLLGMHVLAGSHGMHAHSVSSASSATPAALHHPEAQVHSVHAGHAVAAPDTRTPVSVTPATVTIGGTDVPPSCVCQDGCAGKQTVHAGCTPSPAGASLSAPQPGTTFLDSESWTAVRADRPAGYAYLPGTPTPRDLSISRT